MASGHLLLLIVYLKEIILLDNSTDGILKSFGKIVTRLEKLQIKLAKRNAELADHEAAIRVERRVNSEEINRAGNAAKKIAELIS